MGINYCLSTLASSLHRLRRLGKLARKYENAELREAAGEIADIASDIVLPMIKKLFSLSLGQPIGFPSNNHRMPAELKKAMARFKKDILGRSGLRHTLPDATDCDRFDTYHAIGCQPFTDFEILAHRAVMGIEAQVEELEEMVVLEEEGAEGENNRE